tara:strand:- start:1242 stop:1628 length:387 start_codon:yes stop_codon:yes gene_type:complete
MPEQLSKIREESSPTPEGSDEKKEPKTNWTTTERQNCLRDYGCEIIVDNGSYEDVCTKKAPTDASIVKYQLEDKVCFDLTRGTKIKLFDMYYDKFKNGIKSIDYGCGTIKPQSWGYSSPQQKKKKRKL